MELPMKKHYGVVMNTYGHVLPGAATLARLYQPGKEAKQRLSWIEHYQKQGNGRLTCRYFGIPPKTFYKWLKRYQDKGTRGLESVSTRPHRFRESDIPLEQVDRVRYWRRLYPMYSKYKIAVLLEREDGIRLSPSSVGRIFVRYKLFFASPVAAKHQRFRRVVTKQRLHPYYRSKLPGELAEVDMKHVSFFGQRRYFFVGIDTVSKRLAVHVGTNSTSVQASHVLDAIKNFPFPVTKIRVDNGSENLKDFATKAQELGIREYFTRFRRPKDKPFVERVIETIEKEFIQQGKLASDLEDQRSLVRDWVEHYNTFRPHQSLKYLTPEAFERTLININ